MTQIYPLVQDRLAVHPRPSVQNLLENLQRACHLPLYSISNIPGPPLAPGGPGGPEITVIKS